MEVKLASLDEVCEGISQIVPLLKRYKNRLNTNDFIHDRVSGNGPVVDNLINNLSRQFPEAGRMYWSVRGWSLLVWQPVCVTILAANIWNTHIEVAWNTAQAGFQHCKRYHARCSYDCRICREHGINGSATGFRSKITTFSQAQDRCVPRA